MARNDDGVPMCIMQSQISLTNGSTGLVSIKWTKEHSNPFIQLDKTNWHFPPDIQVPFSIKLDNGQHEFVGVSKTVSKLKRSLIFTYETEEVSDFLEPLASSEAMTINFQGGNEPPWSVKMAGSRDATKSFRACVKILGDTSPAPQATSPVPQAPPIPDANPAQDGAGQAEG